MGIASLIGIGVNLIRTASAAPKPEGNSGKKTVLNPMTNDTVWVKE